MSSHVTTDDDERERKLPCVDFGSFTVLFPDRGHSLFLPVDDLTNPAQAVAQDARGMWLFRAESGVCGVAARRAQVLREGSQVVGLGILHHGQKLEIGGKQGRFYEIRRMALPPGSRVVGRKCEFCRKTHAAGDIVYRCPLCGSAYCADCWKELESRRCCARNCHFSPGVIQEP